MITKEMVEAGVAAFESAFNGSPNSTEMVTTILNAAFAAMPGPAVKVKPLEWSKYGEAAGFDCRYNVYETGYGWNCVKYPHGDSHYRIAEGVSEEAAEDRIAELEKRLADAERVNSIVPDARLDQLIGTGDPTSSETHDMAVEILNRRSAARAYMEGY